MLSPAAAAGDSASAARRSARTRGSLEASHADIGEQHADDRDIREIETLRHHLRAEKNVNLAAVHHADEIIRRIFFARRVLIEAEELRRMKGLFDDLLHTLRAAAHLDHLVAARRTDLGNLARKAAVVADKGAVRMEVETYRAVGALIFSPHLSHSTMGEKPLPVEKIDRLLSRVDRALGMQFPAGLKQGNQESSR